MHMNRNYFHRKCCFSVVVRDVAMMNMSLGTSRQGKKRHISYSCGHTAVFLVLLGVTGWAAMLCFRSVSFSARSAGAISYPNAWWHNRNTSGLGLRCLLTHDATSQLSQMHQMQHFSLLHTQNGLRHNISSARMAKKNGMIPQNILYWSHKVIQIILVTCFCFDLFLVLCIQ